MKNLNNKIWSNLTILSLGAYSGLTQAANTGKLKLDELQDLSNSIRGDGSIVDSVFNIGSFLLFWGGWIIILISLVTAGNGIFQAIKNQRKGAKEDWNIGSSLIYGALSVVVGVIIGLIMISVAGQ